MTTTEIHLADQNYKATDAKNCTLLVRIASARLSYAIIDQATNHLRVLYDAPFAGGKEGLDNVIAIDPFIGQSFDKVKVSLESDGFTFIPREIYSEADLEYYAGFINSTEQTDILVQEIKWANIRNITAVDKILREALISRFDKPFIFHQTSSMIESAIKIYGDTSENVFLLQFNEGAFEALILNSGALRYYNLFSFETVDEFNYYLLAIIKELDIKNADVSVILCGYIDQDDENYARIKKYFGHVSFADIGTLVRGSAAFKGVYAHRFFALTGLTLCE